MIHAFIKSFRHAIRGMGIALKSEQSFRLQIAAALLVTIALFLIPLSRVEQGVLLMAISMILVLELINSTLERMLDLFKPRLHPYVRDIKDLMAAAVLLASIFALVVGILILGPHAFTFLQL